MATFLGLHLATPIDIRMAQTRVVNVSWTGRRTEAKRPDAGVEILAAVRPDFMGNANLAGKIGAHLSEHGSTKPFDEVCPQRLGTLASTQAARFVRAKVAAGLKAVQASGSVAGLRPGRFISFGSNKRLYEVQGVDSSTNVVSLTTPLRVALAANDPINFNPTAQWLWLPDVVDDPPSFSFGFNSGVDWLLGVTEYR